MVLGVCRSSLGDPHDAEDAFQATFLVLARRASSLREPANLGPWLFGVARRTAQKARARRSRLERLTQRVGAMNAIGAASESDRGINREEEARVLHEEIDRLPEKYRTAVVLCDLEGRTHEEAARQLGWPIGTVGVRLMRARERLRDRLTRRGLSPAGSAPFPSSHPSSRWPDRGRSRSPGRHCASRRSPPRSLGPVPDRSPRLRSECYGPWQSRS